MQRSERLALEALMQALARGGNGAEALRVYERLRTLLRDELGVAPDAQTIGVHAALLCDDAPAAGRSAT